MCSLASSHAHTCGTRSSLTRSLSLGGLVARLHCFPCSLNAFLCCSWVHEEGGTGCRRETGSTDIEPLNSHPLGVAQHCQHSHLLVGVCYRHSSQRCLTASFLLRRAYNRMRPEGRLRSRDFFLFFITCTRVAGSSSRQD